MKIAKNDTYGLIGLEPNTLVRTSQNVKNSNDADNVVSMNFADYLNNALNDVDGLQKKAQAASFNVAIGETDYLHNVMIEYQKANLALQLTIEIRNKILEAYQDIMRIQM